MTGGKRAHLGVHVDIRNPNAPLRPVPNPLRLVPQRADHHLKLVVLLPKSPQVHHPLLQARVVGVDLDRHEPLGALARDLARDVGELFDAVVPGFKHALAEGHGALEGRVVHVGEAVGAEHFEELGGEVARDGFDEGEGAADGVGAGNR